MVKIIVAKLDYLIELFLLDENYTILENGTIERKRDGKKLGFTRKGELNRRNKTYVYIYYKGKDLKLHRIIYAKFKGNLDENMVVHHIDNNTLNNSIENLDLVTQEINQAYRKV